MISQLRYVLRVKRRLKMKIISIGFTIWIKPIIPKVSKIKGFQISALNNSIKGYKADFISFYPSPNGEIWGWKGCDYFDSYYKEWSKTIKENGCMW